MLSAGTDPTYVPGLDTLTATPAEPEPTDDQAPPEPADGSQDGEEATDPSQVAETGADHDGAAADAAAGTEAEADSDSDSAPDSDADEEQEEAPPEGPSFEVSDRRAAVIADGRGVLLRLDDAEARFEWSEIGAVEIGTARFGRRFQVCVCTTGHRRFDAEVEASSRKQAKEWADDLDSVLDTWFDDSAE